MSSSDSSGPGSGGGSGGGRGAGCSVGGGSGGGRGAGWLPGGGAAVGGACRAVKGDVRLAEFTGGGAAPRGRRGAGRRGGLPVVAAAGRRVVRLLSQLLCAWFGARRVRRQRPGCRPPQLGRSVLALPRHRALLSVGRATATGGGWGAARGCRQCPRPRHSRLCRACK